jgi:hypothetical protein
MYGPGSIINLRRIAVMPVSSDSWRDFERLESPTFEQQINAEGLVDTSSVSIRGIPAVIFPHNYFCAKCGLIRRKEMVNKAALRDGFTCELDACDGKLYPSRWIVYCTLRGHIDDFDYDRFVHNGRATDHRIRIRPESTLADTIVVCDCGLSRSIEEAYHRGAAGQCRGRMPWLQTQEDCTAPNKFTMRSASDVYFGAVRSALTIEPESNRVFRDVSAYVRGCESAFVDTPEKGFNAVRSRREFRNVSDEIVRRVVDYNLRLEPAADDAYKNHRISEFAALSDSSGSRDDDFWTEEVTSDGLARFGIDKLVAVRRLREVRALVGFSRGAPAIDPGFDNVDGEQRLFPVTIQRVRKYPAYENRGEGIFLRLDSARLVDWLARPAVLDRERRFFDAEQRWRSESNRPGKALRRGVFVLAHSLAHVLIRQISLHCGYMQASLRERIYASASDDHPWAGVLVYTASSDADGSLGGLVSIALNRQLPAILEDAVNELAICSSDPTCALELPVGFRKLNASACHACIVLPETCCERANRFLDRNFVVPQTLSDQTDQLCFATSM